jgi:hypothetical protein
MLNFVVEDHTNKLDDTPRVAAEICSVVYIYLTFGET